LPIIKNTITQKQINKVDPNILAKLTYLYGEIAVLVLRNEFRDQLAVIENYNELINCLEVSHNLIPKFGFDQAIKYCNNYTDSNLKNKLRRSIK
jgi:hypothetical protein